MILMKMPDNVTSGIILSCCTVRLHRIDYIANIYNKSIIYRELETLLSTDIALGIYKTL